MTTISHALDLGTRRGSIEFRHGLTDRSDLSANVFFGLLPLAFLLWFHASGEPVDVGGQPFPLVRFVAPGMYAMVVMFSTLGPLYQLAADREDGTLLRARTLPHGLTSYVVGKTVTAVLETLFGLLVLVLVPALLIIDGLAAVPPTGWVWFVVVLCLGLTAILPLGVAGGALLRSPRGVFTFGIAGLAALSWFSGLIQPLTTFPAWVQHTARVLPFHWMGHGLRHALLPDPLRDVEVGGQWRPWLTLLVLGLWSVIGLVTAPLVLRRAASRESGAKVQARRDAALQRTA